MEYLNLLFTANNRITNEIKHIIQRIKKPQVTFACKIAADESLSSTEILLSDITIFELTELLMPLLWQAVGR